MEKAKALVTTFQYQGSVSSAMKLEDFNYYAPVPKKRYTSLSAATETGLKTTDDSA